MERTAREAGIHDGNNLYTDLDYTDDVVLMAEQTDITISSRKISPDRRGPWFAPIVAEN